MRPADDSQRAAVSYRPPLTLRNQIIIGTMSGWTEICVCQPIDTYKTGLQSVKRVRFAEFLNKGITHWYAGMSPMLVFRAIYISSLKVANESYRTWTIQRGNDPTTRANMIAGGVFAGVMATPVSCVSEWFKTQMQNNGLSLRALIDQNRRSFKAFAGLSATTLREAGYGATLFALNPIFRENLHDAMPDVHMGITNVFAGISAGVCGGLLTQPFDTTKTMLQEKYGNSVKTSIWRTVLERYQRFGLLSFWAGGVPRASRLAIGTFILDRCMFYYTNLVLAEETPRALPSLASSSNAKAAITAVP